MNHLKSNRIMGLGLLAAILVSSCKEETVAPQLVADAGIDTTASIGDTVRLNASGSTGKDYDILWELKSQPGNDTIVHPDSMHAWFIPLSNGLYQVRLVLTRENLYSEDYRNITVSGAVVLNDTISHYTRLLKIAKGNDTDYLVQGNLVVMDELIIDPNVIIELEETASIRVKEEGLIYADHVSFIPADSSWKGIHLTSGGNVFSNCLIDGGGNASFTGQASGKASLLAGGSATLAFSGNTIRNSRGYGISIIENADFYFNQANQVYPFNGNSFESNHSGPMVIPAGVLGDLVAQVFTSETPGTSIEIYGSSYSSQEEKNPLFSDLGLPYRITGLLTFHKNLSITKGVEMHFDTDAGLKVNGMLSASGTADEPVVMDGMNSTPSSWMGICVNNGQASLAHASILNAGSAVFSGLSVKASLIANQTLNLRHCIISGSGGIGVYLPEYAHILYSDNFSNNIISGNAISAVRVRLDDVSKVTEGNTVTAASSTVPAIEIHMGLDDPLGTWPDLGSDIDYKILESLKIKSTKDLIIQDGVTVQFVAGTFLEVSGGLQAAGSTGSGITFEGSLSKKGHWDGIFLNGTKTVTMDHVVIRDGGGGLTDKANVIVEATATDVSITHSAVTNSKGYGVLIKAGAQDFNINETASGNTLEGDLGGFYKEN